MGNEHVPSCIAGEFGLRTKGSRVGGCGCDRGGEMLDFSFRVTVGPGGILRSVYEFWSNFR